MQTVNINAAKTHPSRLVDAAAAGEEILIARAGKPVARLVPLLDAQARPRRRLGLLAGQVSVPADSDAPLPNDILRAFEGRWCACCWTRTCYCGRLPAAASRYRYTGRTRGA